MSWPRRGGGSRTCGPPHLGVPPPPSFFFVRRTLAPILMPPSRREGGRYPTLEVQSFSNVSRQSFLFKSGSSKRQARRFLVRRKVVSLERCSRLFFRCVVAHAAARPAAFFRRFVVCCAASSPHAPGVVPGLSLTAVCPVLCGYNPAGPTARGFGGAPGRPLREVFRDGRGETPPGPLRPELKEGSLSVGGLGGASGMATFEFQPFVERCSSALG